MVMHGEEFYPAEMDGYVAEHGSENIGLLILRKYENVCEIISLTTTGNIPGVGKKLVEHAIVEGKHKGAQYIAAVTTNDNLTALRFYQQLGFSIKAWRKNAVTQSRIIKPEIPLIGNHNIPIRDEIELEMKI